VPEPSLPIIAEAVGTHTALSSRAKAVNKARRSMANLNGCRVAEMEGAQIA
jgi:hypothetical protein